MAFGDQKSWRVGAVRQLILDPQNWATEQFGACDLGDIRRTRRAVRFATQIAADSCGSTPQQTSTWKDCKAAYRLIDSDDVTHEALTAPHFRRTRQLLTGHCLALGDTTELDFGIRKRIAGLGPTGDGNGRGFFLHSSLLVSRETEEIFGLMGQELFYRKARPANETRYERVQRPRESEVWGRVIDEIGPPTANARLTHVFDRGADNFEVYGHLLLSKADWIVRASQMSRQMLTPLGELRALDQYLEKLPVAGSYELKVRKQKDQSARTATVEVRYGLVTMPAPCFRTPWIKQCGVTSITMWVVEGYEVNAPSGVKPLRWVLYTSHAVESFQDAMRVIGDYEKRTLIEEYHKAIKTGCRVEERQYETSHRLEAITGLLAVVAVRLLQLKSVARTDPERPAASVVPQTWIDVLRTLRGISINRPLKSWTVQNFFRELAGLGGYLGRKHDGEPGWQTIWHGFGKLVPALRYAEQHKKCG